MAGKTFSAFPAHAQPSILHIWQEVYDIPVTSLNCQSVETKYLETNGQTDILASTLQWRHNGIGGVSNHQPHDCLLNRLFRCKSSKIRVTIKALVTGFCMGNSPLTGEFPAQRASNAENVSIWWRPHDNSTLETDKPPSLFDLKLGVYHHHQKSIKVGPIIAAYILANSTPTSVSEILKFDICESGVC